jgi:hypothetical protein
MGVPDELESLVRWLSGLSSIAEHRNEIGGPSAETRNARPGFLSREYRVLRTRRYGPVVPTMASHLCC